MIETERVPSTAKGRATRARVVDAAAELMYASGVAGTSLDDVGAAAGVGRSQMYHYFGDRSDLIRAVVQRQADAVVGRQQALLAELDDWDAWQRWRDAVLHAQRASDCAGGCPLGSLANELAVDDAGPRDLLGAGFDRWEAVFRRGVERMQERGLVRPQVDAATVAVTLLAMTQGGLLLAKTRRDTAPLAIALDGAVAYLRSLAVAA